MSIPSRGPLPSGASLEAWRARHRRFRWLLVICFLAMAGVTAAGLWAIAVARRGVVDHATTVLQLDTAERARSLASHLSSTRSELAFLARSAPLEDLDIALLSDRPEDVRWRRMWAEATLILFLRAHPEIGHARIKTTDGETIIAVGRRGGVPVAWRPSGASALGSEEITTQVELRSESAGAGAVHLVASLDPAALLVPDNGRDDVVCSIGDTDGTLLVTGEHPDETSTEWDGRRLRAEAVVNVQGWSRAGPWSLSCEQPESPAVGALGPLVNRYRLTLALNLGIAIATVFLGLFAILQIRRRERLEWAASEESRVREIERQLFHSERLATVGRLAAGFAHEINNPLEGVYNYLHLAAEALKRDDTEDAQRRLEQVKEGLGRVSMVLRQVLAHADPAAGRQSRVDLRKAVTQAVDLVRTRKEFQGIRFELDIERSGADVTGHPVLLGQVLLNLVLNACEAQPEGGEVKVTIDDTQDGITVEVADRGPGVPSEHASRIFEPFFSTKGSSGLGLSICHAIVRQQGGELSIGEQPGGGALLRLRLPASPPEGPRGEGEAA